ncbi:MAG: helix-turn-helix transcriptional regulator [Candidatus Izemoplasmatales bacterium]
MRQKRLCPTKVGHKITLLRNASNTTSKEFATKLGVSSSSLRNWEKGNNLPTLENVVKICNTFHISINNLILYED